MNPNAAALAFVATLEAAVADVHGTDAIGNVHSCAGNALIDARNAANYKHGRGVFGRDLVEVDAETAKAHFVAAVERACAYTFGIARLSARTQREIAAASAIAF